MEAMSHDERETLTAIAQRPRTIPALISHLGLSGEADEVLALVQSVMGLIERGYIEIASKSDSAYYTYTTTPAGKFAFQREDALDEMLRSPRHREVTIDGRRYAVDLVMLEAATK